MHLYTCILVIITFAHIYMHFEYNNICIYTNIIIFKIHIYILGFLKFKSNQILGQFEFDQIRLTLIWIWFDSNIWIWIWFEFEFLIVIFKSNQIFVKSNQIWPDLNLIKSNIVKFEFEFDQIFDSNIWRSNQIAEL